MTPINVLIELFERVGSCQGARVLVNDEELKQWPTFAVKAMKSQKLLAKSRPAASAICPGCERECVMPVHSLVGTGGGHSSFIVCDKRSDITRVLVSPEQLIQWHCSADLICGFVAGSLALRSSTGKTNNAGRWEIGICFGEKRSQMLCLEANGKLALRAGDNMVPLAELIQFHGAKYSLDGEVIRRLVDAATTADERYTPTDARREIRKLDTQAMYRDWKKVYRELKKNHPNMSDVWISRKIAKMDIARDHDSETIRKNMKK